MVNNKKNIIDEKEIPKYSEAALIRTIEASKKSYEKFNQAQTSNTWEFLFTQFTLIKKNLWIIQLSLLLFIYISLCKLNVYVSQMECSVYFSIFIPILVISAIPEMWKNIQYKSLEIEGSTRYNLKKVYIARILIIGMADLIFASLLMALVSYATNTPIYWLIIYFLVPFNSTSCLLFTVLCSKRSVNSQFVSTSICVIWSVIWYEVSKQGKIYEMIQMKVWILLILLSIGYLIYMIKRILKDCKNYSETLDFTM